MKVTILSIKEKETDNRMPYLVLGVYKDWEALLNSLKKYNLSEFYDLRTLKFHDVMSIPENNVPTTIALDCLYDDLLYKGE